MSNNTSKIVTRFAPSPTGVLHVGSARTALFNYLFAKKHNGKCILRIEDTDKKRSKKEYEEEIKEGLKWIGVEFDEEYKQSERTEIYKKYLLKLISSGSAYISKEDAVEEGESSEVIRFKNPNTKISFEDTIRGVIEFDTTDLGDFVIAKNLDTPLYNFVVVVDDYLMGVTHIIRGEDGIPNTPRQILIQEAIGANRPVYAHTPLILAQDRSKLSKRHGAVSVLDYRDSGYIAEAVVNFLVFIGWNPGTDKEIFTVDELVDAFSIEKIQKGGAIFNTEKLDWFNREYIKKMNIEDVVENIKNRMQDKLKDVKGVDFVKLKKILPVILERISVFSEIEKMLIEGELEYLFSTPEYDGKKLLWKNENSTEHTKKYLIKIIEILESLSNGDFTSNKIKKEIWDYATEHGRGNVLWPMRYALSGKDKSPDPFTLAGVLDKKETVMRLKIAIEKLSNI